VVILKQLVEFNYGHEKEDSHWRRGNSVARWNAVRLSDYSSSFLTRHF